MAHGVRHLSSFYGPASLISLILEGTLRSSSREGFVTAKGIARDRRYDRLIPILEPSIHHHIPASHLEQLETHVHDLMMHLAGPLVSPPMIDCLPTYTFRRLKDMSFAFLNRA